MSRLRILVVSLVWSVALSARSISSWNFDWDDNIFYMPTKIVLWDATRKVELPVSPEEFAVIGGELGKPGRWRRYTVRAQTFRFFEDAANAPSRFIADVERGLTEPENGWRGPSWTTFQKATENDEVAEWTSIITARGHAPEAILSALGELKSRGFIHSLPKREHIFPVSYAGLPKAFRAEPAGNVAPAKAAVMKSLLDQLNAVPVEKGERHSWNFSDDDFKNISKAREVLAPEIARGRWPHVKISLSFTGRNHPTEAPRTILLGR